ncbi:hypothetical protein ASG43_03235 [Aureimonas sp. Leaf454]|uniref:hypothetical protein n=1 Tax=Aureimonas sp. Leaf454 TaxID=1736381 RepID=UPI0007012E52|nr:hypothetical protein [Aureimonas sp. Leaf454]KQT54613.1 hypothetical protein ASG43_03235 [Aureimonas sp. Leaf454]
MFGDLKAVMAGILCLVLGLLVGGVIVRGYDAWVIIPDAERVATERADARWKDAVAEAKAKAERDRQKAEAEIADAERVYLERDAARASQMTALEQALEQELARAPTPSPSRGSAACGPAIPRGVRDALQGVGRAPARPPAAKPDAALPRGG